MRAPNWIFAPHSLKHWMLLTRTVVQSALGTSYAKLYLRVKRDESSFTFLMSQPRRAIAALAVYERVAVRCGGSCGKGNRPSVSMLACTRTRLHACLGAVPLISVPTAFP